MQWVIVRCLISVQRQILNFNVMCVDDCVYVCMCMRCRLCLLHVAIPQVAVNSVWVQLVLNCLAIYGLSALVLQWSNVN